MSKLSPIAILTQEETAAAARKRGGRTDEVLMYEIAVKPKKWFRRWRTTPDKCACGGEVEMRYRELGWGCWEYFIRCPQCVIRSEGDMQKGMAIHKWNDHA